jgi:glyoxylase-like metal-dependent hydrolase (beta-lactamase superfamily II)
MVQEIKCITFGGVNCYLIHTTSGFFLVDTGFSKKRYEIERELEIEGCTPGKLKLILLTHGDFDHCGNCAYFRKKFSAKIAMNAADKGMVENGDMFYNRKANVLMRFMGKLILFFLKTNLNKSDRFTPDFFLEDGLDLSDFGFDAKIVCLPGHSKGSIGVLTGAGDLFCGDLLENKKKPAKNSLTVDNEAFKASVEKLKQLKVGTVHPGHGKAFELQEFLEKRKKMA